MRKECLSEQEETKIRAEVKNKYRAVAERLGDRHRDAVT